MTRVLVVDDERGIRMRVARDVKACDPNLVIFEAANGQEAQEKLMATNTLGMGVDILCVSPWAISTMATLIQKRPCLISLIGPPQKRVITQPILKQGIV